MARHAFPLAPAAQDVIPQGVAISRAGWARPCRAEYFRPQPVLDGRDELWPPEVQAERWAGHHIEPRPSVWQAVGGHSGLLSEAALCSYGVGQPCRRRQVCLEAEELYINIPNHKIQTLIFKSHHIDRLHRVNDPHG